MSGNGPSECEHLGSGSPLSVERILPLGVVGNGFEITVPADTTTKTLKLYVGVWFTQDKLKATLSDASAPAYVDTTLNNRPSGCTLR